MDDIKDDNIIELVPASEDAYEHVSPDAVLLGAMKNLKSCIVVGIDNTDHLYMATSDGDLREAVFLLETVKHKLISGNINDGYN